MKWRTSLDQALIENEESFNDIIACTYDDDDLDMNIDQIGGVDLVAWTSDFVYFGAQDHNEIWYCASIERNPY